MNLLWKRIASVVVGLALVITGVSNFSNGHVKAEDASINTSSKTQTDYRTSSSNSFPSSIYYNSGGYSGTLYRSGSSFVTSGSPGDSKSVSDYRTSSTASSFPSSISYNSGGYTGH